MRERDCVDARCNSLFRLTTRIQTAQSLLRVGVSCIILDVKTTLWKRDAKRYKFVPGIKGANLSLRMRFLQFARRKM